MPPVDAAGTESPAPQGRALGPLVDTHCHLALLEDRGLLNQALESAAEAGVDQMISVGLNIADSDRNRVLAEGHRGVYFSVGWHPHESVPPDSAQRRALAELLAHPLAVAVGEIGLDRYWRPGYHEVPFSVQQRSLRIMLELASEHSKPVIIHDRDAHSEILAELAGRPEVRGVMHCFSGDADFARRCAALGYVISFAGTITFPRSEGIQDAARAVAVDGFTVETDAPFLAPVPHRGRPNLPGYIAATAAAVAELRNTSVAGVRASATATARRLFELPPS